MCIVIDINCLSKVFNLDDKEHEKYTPVLNWIIQGKGKIVYGGSSYKDELEKTRKYLKILTEFERKGKRILIDDYKIDIREIEVRGLTGKKCDDPHLIALFDISGCKLDNRSLEFIKDKKFYKYHNPPRIYKSKRNENLLSDKYIANICKKKAKLV